MYSDQQLRTILGKYDLVTYTKVYSASFFFEENLHTTLLLKKDRQAHFSDMINRNINNNQLLFTTVNKLTSQYS